MNKRPPTEHDVISNPDSSEAELTRAMEEYLERLERGEEFDRQEFRFAISSPF